MDINKLNLRIRGALQYGNNPTKIILHHPEFYGSPEELNEMMISDGFSMCGYHYYIRKDGAIYEMRPVNAMGAHCFGQNLTSIGISAEGNYMNDIMPEAQKQAIIDLCKYLIQIYPSINEVGPHKKYYNTDCPGTNFPVDEILRAVGTIGRINASGASNSILDLQKALNRLQIRDSKGEKLSEDGISGSCTVTATKRFQFLVGLEVDGIPGTQTWEALNAILDKPICSIDQKPVLAVTRYLQYRFCAAVDGIFGQATDQAVRTYQAGKGLIVDGIVGAATWDILIG